MIVWKRQNVFNLLCLFGDDKPHSWLEVVNLGTRLFLDVPIQNHKYKTHQDKFEAFLQKAIEYGIIEMIPTPYVIKVRTRDSYMISKHDFNYKLSAKGDKLLRQEQAEREADRAFYYNMFDRTVDGPNGVDRFAPLTPTELNIRNKQTYKVKNMKKENQ
jgi:hypothetical protein